MVMMNEDALLSLKDQLSGGNMSRHTPRNKTSESCCQRSKGCEELRANCTCAVQLPDLTHDPVE